MRVLVTRKLLKAGVPWVPLILMLLVIPIVTIAVMQFVRPQTSEYFGSQLTGSEFSRKRRWCCQC